MTSARRRSAGAPALTGAHDVDTDALAAVLNDFAATVTGDFSVDDILSQLGSGVARVLDVDGAGVMTPRAGGGVLRVVFATPGPAEAVERLEESLGEGPCHDAYLSGEPVAVDDLTSTGRWPALERRAGAVGVRAVTAVPMRARGRLWGVLNLYRLDSGPLTAAEQAAATTLANLATSYLVVAADRDAARNAQDELAHRATHDPLTDLPTRWMFFEQVSHAIAGLARRPGHVGVLFLDLDALKEANDTFGHEAGDRLLTTVAERVRGAVRPTDVLARLGGDEFVVLLEDLTTPGAAGTVAQRILDSLRVPYRLAGRAVSTSVSIGIATTDDPAQTADALVSQADSAMYRAKDAGRGRYEVFDAVTHAAERARTTAQERLIADLTHALRAGELVLHYQPIVDLLAAPADRERGVYAVEALVRWRHPTRGVLPAGAFIDAAVGGGLINDLGAWVLAEACRQLTAWDDELGARAPQRVFVNVSTQELTDPRLPGRVADTVRAHGLDPRRLTLEITESGVISHPEVTVSALEQVRALGVQLAIDDFGTGYSSLGRLLEIPATTLKVDQSFTRGLSGNRDAAAVVSAVLLLGHNLRRTVVVEGVENAETLEALHELGCTHVQGYFVSMPQHPDELRVQLVDPPWLAATADPGY
ncbi:bifunctional diguanylate cyclase/phosphodiesterase [uncultured Cellulomonas sp.]|uniref:putative bifunctional diguanylate cyclase/phosphodiesterase n=1 Tax=uncultured Cellulomonas sp. TaxID=189682 RepID=UPI00262A219D|nr:EAL domain-containing protein [uncultured Cellulomonas sp.]